ncbi:translation initiation factor Sui1 [Denitrificimonas sp. JX-1]|uniref:Translation initiation factor Sui1 n=1 Tax=Denitrificimonas halotolerans TaxID=3098930 RepID=A0ABU5GU31_9GAMM|nr:translation initiation factor Sui1 [Denitrificimonas sp. JX-1]MDY7220493.1 translation initiation factor Sui1 [Denitrificimonas sp. JX-1]
MKKASSFAALSGLVYSTDSGRHCPECEQPQTACICAEQPVNTGDGVARVRRESKGRGGKTVTTIQGLCLTLDELKKLTAELKKRCGCGGSLKEGVIEIQGDKLDVLLDELRKRGFTAKQAGG